MDREPIAKTPLIRRRVPPKAKQKLVMDMLDGVLAQASR
jgi:hypothetical protein